MKNINNFIKVTFKKQLEINESAPQKTIKVNESSIFLFNTNVIYYLFSNA